MLDNITPLPLHNFYKIFFWFRITAATCLQFGITTALILQYSIKYSNLINTSAYHNYVSARSSYIWEAYTPRSNKFVSELLHVVFIEKCFQFLSGQQDRLNHCETTVWWRRRYTDIPATLTFNSHTSSPPLWGHCGVSPCRECLSHKGGIAWEKDEQKSSELHQSEQVPESEQLQKRKKRVKFTAKEEEEISGYFATELAAKTTTTLFSWQEFLRDHPYTIGTRNKSRTRLRTWLSSHKLS